MAKSPTLGVRITADLAQFRQGLGSVRKSVLNLNGLLAGALSGISIAATVGAIVKATVESEAALAQLEARLKSTKGAAGLTKRELVDLASSLQVVTTYGDEAIIGAESLLLTFTRIGRDVFPLATEAVLNMATAMGTDLNSAALQVGKALNDPIQGVGALSRAGVQFTESQKAMIQQLVKAGNVIGAQKIILGELETQFGGAARAARNTLGGAFTALKEAAGDLLEGDAGSGGVRGVSRSINDLVGVLQDPKTKEAFASIVTGVFNTASAFASFAAEAKNAFDAAQRWVTFRLGGTRNIDDLKQIRFEIQQIQGTIDSIESAPAWSQWLSRGDLATARKRMAELKALERQSLSIFGDPDTPKAPAKPSDSSGNGQDAAATAAAAEAAAAAKARAKARAAALAREQDRLRKEAEEAEEKRKAELEARKERIATGLREVEIALSRSTGKEADAAFKEIDDKWKQLLADLKAAGNKEGEALVERLIDHEKFQVELDELSRQFENTLRGFDTDAALIQAQLEAGKIDPGEAERRLNEVRQTSLDRLRQMRDAAFAYYKTHTGPEADAALQRTKEFDIAIAGMEKSQNELAIKMANQAVDSLTGFFTDLATGAKSAKEAFQDFVRSFVAGIAQIIARELALAAVRAALGAFGASGVAAAVRHSGGIVGQGGTMRSGLNPMLWGEAPRFHSGGIAGLGPNEVPAVLQRGEEVLTKNDPRHVRNGGRGGGSGATPIVRNVILFDADAVVDHMGSAAGEKVILQVIGKNPGRVKQMLG